MLNKSKKIYISEWTKVKTYEIKRKYGVEKIDERDFDFVSQLDRQGKISIKQLSNGIELESYSYVGVIKLTNFQIIIMPKIEKIQLARMISFAYNLDSIHLYEDSTNITYETGLISDIFAALFVKEVEKIMQKGLSQRYKEREEQLSSCRGKILFNRLARNSSLGLTLPCRYQELTTDIVENRIILSSLKQLFVWVNTPALKRKISILIEKLSSKITYGPLSISLLNKVKHESNRLTSHYNTLIELAEILLKSLDFDLTVGKRNFISFLLDMNLLFEKFLYKYMIKSTDSTINIKYQNSLINKFISQNGGQHKLIPDYKFYRNNMLVSIADAKYKNYNYKRISSGDLYQLTVYAIANMEQINEIYLFYPSDKEFQERKYHLNNMITQEPIKIVAKGLPISWMLNNLGSNYLRFC
ncbi:MAG: McrC family protein [Halanaerobiales bacterium]